MIPVGRLKSIVLKDMADQTATRLPKTNSGQPRTCVNQSSSTILSGIQKCIATPATRGITCPSGIGMLLHRKLLMLTVIHTGAQRLALAAWWENQPTKRNKAFAWTLLFCTAHHQVRCTHCWATSFDYRLIFGYHTSLTSNAA
jgi:hypothetical protein